MKTSWLSLERHTFKRIAIEAAEKPDLKASNALQLSLEIAHHETDDFRVKISLDVAFLAESGKNPAYTGEISMEGFFRIGHDPDMKIVITNGASILYGAIREMLLNLTFRGPWPPVLLPTASFGDMADNLMAQNAEPILAETRPVEVAGAK
ncbi:MAG: hypothetical protein QOH88_1559 [Verrucomicrobiota bacterium]|jgi:preprotein translocase subunit SecB